MNSCSWCNTLNAKPFPSESAKYAHLVTHLMPPSLNVVEIGSGGWPVVPHALQVELGVTQFQQYTRGEFRPPVQWRLGHVNLMTGIGFELPFKNSVADVVFSSHLIEDIACDKTEDALREWARILKPGGLMIILHPDKKTWNHCIEHLGQPPNCEHRCERAAGDLGIVASKIGMVVERDEMTNLWENDYNILCLFRKP